MPNHSDKTDDLFKNRRLPGELTKRFDRWGVSRSEQNAFLDRIEKLFASDEELADIATADNPWAKIAEVEALRSEAELAAKAEKMIKEMSPAVDQAGGSDPKPQRAQKLKSKPKSMPDSAVPVLSEEKLPEITSADEPGDPHARGIARYNEDEARSHLNTIRLVYSLDLPGKDPEVVLEEPDRSIYKLLIEALQKFDSLRKSS